jgi:CRISPR-associated endonuclease Cas1
MSATARKMNEATDMTELLMIEARNRQQYYRCFNEIIKSEGFLFEKRTKRPPRDPLNAMISFGNVCLYQRIATELYKHQLDIRIGFLHATNNRSQSLNLDIAELFKPIIVDRTIFTLINKGMIHPVSDFESTSEGGIYLNSHGKSIFLQEYENKLYQKVTQNDTKVTYDTLIRQETRKIFRTIHYGENYKPFKYIN